jgi:hypothetical protein
MILIKDDFYSNPDKVREFALSLDFNKQGNYPGNRTCAMGDGAWRLEIKSYLESLINKKITSFPYGYNTAFQFTTKESSTWVHHDNHSFAGVVYLTPDADLDSGTGLYRHKKTGIMRHSEGLEDFNKIETDIDEWELVLEVKNIYNRIFIYNAMYYHRSMIPGFGSCKETGRLFQTFFFEAE